MKHLTCQSLRTVFYVLGLGAGILFLQSSRILGADGPATISVQPQSQTVLQGDPASFSVSVDGTPPFFYQWQRNGTLIGGATNAAYTIPSASMGDQGAVFTVIVTNALGSATSSSAVLQVDPGILTTNVIRLVDFASPWRYNQTANLDGVAWQARAYDDVAWLSGNGLLGVESAALPAPIATTLTLGRTTYYFRARFNYSQTNLPSRIVSTRFVLNAIVDDGAALYLNGTELFRTGLDVSVGYADLAARTVGDATTEGPLDLAASGLVSGENVLAAEVHQVTTGSSDIVWGMSLDAVVVIRRSDQTAPTMQQVIPAPSSTVSELSMVSVVFDERVTGVEAGDLWVNGAPANGILVVSSREYQFTFPQPPYGLVTVEWAANHGIADLASVPNAFVGGSWTYMLDTNALPAVLIISEFMADNANGIRDEDGSRADWIEIYNPGPLDQNLDGWFLTDTATNLAQWRFPSLNLGPNKYLLVWASSKDRTNAALPLHTNFKLEKSGEFLALVDPRTNIASAFFPVYPAQQADVSFGRDRVDFSLVGFFVTPTPGEQNATSGAGFAPVPIFSVDSGVYTNDTLSVTLTAPYGTIRYTTDGTVPTSNSTVYSSPVTVNASRALKARVFPPASSNLWPSPVVAKTYMLLDATTRDFTSDLPILIINSAGQGIASSVAPGQPRTRGTLLVQDTFRGRSSLRGTPDFHGLAEFEIFGQTSAGFPKKPYNIEVQDELGNDLDVSLLGMPAEADWKLRNPYSDKCLMNDFLGYELFEQMGHYQVRRRFVEVFVDSGGGKLTYPGDYHGVLVLLEKIERGRDRVDIAELTTAHTNEPAISGGYMFKKDKDSTGDLNFSTTGGGGFSAQALKMHEPKARDITTAQFNWIKNYINRFEASMYATDWLTRTGTNHYSHYIDVDSFVDMHWIVEFTRQIDGYRLSSYFQKDRNGKIKWEPIWDWNLSFGNADYANGEYTNGWYYADNGENAHIWMRRLMSGSTSATGTTGDPDFNQRIADRWGVLRTNVLNGTNVVHRIDEVARQLNQAQARDFARFPRLGTYVWPNPAMYSTPTTYSGIITNMKNWTINRFRWIDSQFTPVPTFNTGDAQVTTGFSLVMAVPAGATIYYTLNGTDPRAPGGNPAPGVLTYTGPISIQANARVVARARKVTGSWNNTWSGPSAITLYTALPALRITEVNYHPYPPAPGNTNDAENFEFIEVKNIGATALNVNQFTLAGGISFVFPNLVLQAGQTAVVVRDVAAFQSRYGATALVAGVYTGSLNNAGDEIILLGRLHEPIHRFTYSDAWYPITDGIGFSLVAANESGPLPDWNLKTGWRVSAARGGSPGAVDPGSPLRPAVFINEVLTRADTNLTPSLTDTIELFNSTTNDVDLGGWFLTDDFATPWKFRIPDNTTIPASGYLTFTEADFNPNPGFDPSFALSARGDEVYLFSADLNWELTGYAHGFDFGAQANGVTFGRQVISTGEDHFVVQREPTLGTNNAGPLVGPVVISEIMYHPSDVVANGSGYNNTEDEFIELRNMGAETAYLYDTAYPTNTWRLDDAVEYAFPTNVSISPGDYLLVVSFDPVASPSATAAFRARNLVPASVPLFGPWNGELSNDSDSVELRRPNCPETNGIAYILVERVRYSDTAPWPAGADGIGLSLQRVALGEYGNDPANWAAAAPNPGGAYVGGTLPTLLSQPGNQLLVTGTDVQFAVEATGSAPLRYQWRYNDLSIEGATNAIYVMTNVSLSAAGIYSVVVYNGGGSAVSSNFIVGTRVGLRFLKQPQSIFVLAGTGTNFSVQVEGTGLVRYQWYYNGVAVLNATNFTYPISSAQTTNAGTYAVRVTDDVETKMSASVVLSLVTKPSLVLQPIFTNQVVEGGTASFSVMSAGTLPIGHRWRFKGVTITTANVANAAILSVPGGSVLTVSDARLTNAGNFSVVASNVAGTAPVSSNAWLVVLADTDRDGLPDLWETNHPGFNPSDPSDGARDEDGDGMSNGAEWYAGTDYLDPASFLKVELTLTNTAMVQFNAVSNRTYSVQYADGLEVGLWHKLGDVPARTTSRLEVLIDPDPTMNRFYRIVTPVQP